MRYREDIPPEQWAVNASDDMLLFTVLLGIIISIALTWLGIKGKQMWLVFWSAGLMIANLSYLVYVFFIKT